MLAAGGRHHPARRRALLAPARLAGIDVQLLAAVARALIFALILVGLVLHAVGSLARRRLLRRRWRLGKLPGRLGGGHAGGLFFLFALLLFLLGLLRGLLFGKALGLALLGLALLRFLGRALFLALALALGLLLRHQALFFLGDDAALHIGTLAAELDADGLGRGRGPPGARTPALAGHFQLADGLALQRNLAGLAGAIVLAVHAAQVAEQLALFTIVYQVFGQFFKPIPVVSA